MASIEEIKRDERYLEQQNLLDYDNAPLLIDDDDLDEDGIDVEGEGSPTNEHSINDEPFQKRFDPS